MWNLVYSGWFSQGRFLEYLWMLAGMMVERRRTWRRRKNTKLQEQSPWVGKKGWDLVHECIAGLLMHCIKSKAMGMNPGRGGFVMVGTGRNSLARPCSLSDIADKVIRWKWREQVSKAREQAKVNHGASESGGVRWSENLAAVQCLQFKWLSASHWFTNVGFLYFKLERTKLNRSQVIIGKNEWEEECLKPNFAAQL